MTRPDGDRDPREEDAGPESPERDLEAPAADAVEQSMSADPAEAAGRSAELRPGLEVAEWDAVEQSIVVDLDDEYDR